MDPNPPINPAPTLPNYPAGPQMAPTGFHKPLYKAMKMLMRKGRTSHRGRTGRGIHISPDVHVTEKKVKWY